MIGILEDSGAPAVKPCVRVASTDWLLQNGSRRTGTSSVVQVTQTALASLCLLNHG